MALAAGTRIGQYEIQQLLGAGGMGEVYRARDVRLARDVAVKILPDQFAEDADRLARFEREATTLASLNHPHIAQLYGVEESGATHALVMEFVEGEDLARRIRRGPIPVGEALALAAQLAEALEAAHGAGVVHRDLKPGNIRVRPDATVKVLDFGLAKPAAPSDGGEVLPTSPTITSPAVTEAGVILGTAAYMSPEQAKGRLVDRRADIWAFGCVLFEMLSGRSGFLRATVTETLAAILERQPDWTMLPPDVPPGIRKMLERCLQKDLRRRLHDIADARIEIEEALAAPPTERKPRERATANVLRAAWLAIPILAVAGAVFVVRSRPAPVVPSEVRVDRLTDFAGLEEMPAISPDGRSVAFTAAVGKTRQVFVQLLAGGAPLRVTRDPVDHQFPRWSLDSSSLVYFSPATSANAPGMLLEIAALGGRAPRRIANSLGSADVNLRDGRLTFFRLTDEKIQLAISPPDGANITSVAEFPPGRYYLHPRWSPDGRWIAYQRGDGIRFDLFVVPAQGGDPRQLTRENLMMNGLAWLPDSSGILYSSSRGNTMPYLPATNLWRVALGDGTVRQVTSGETSYVHPDVAANGVIVAARMRLQSDIWKFPADGPPAVNVEKAMRVTRQTGHVLTPTVGADDREVAFLSDSGGHANLWIANTETGDVRQVTHERDPNVAVGVPVWSPDGTAIAFVYSRGNPGLAFGVWLVSPDGSNLRSVANPGLGPAWSQDGKWIYYSTLGAQSPADVVLKKLSASGGEPIVVSTERLRNVIGSDGSTLYYVFERPLVDGTPEFEIRAATPDDGPFRVVARLSSTRVPLWQIVNPTLSPDGKWMAQALTDGFTTNIWALSTATAEWRQVTDFAERPTFIARRVSWSADGRSVVAAVAEGDADIVRLEGLLDARH